MTTVSLYISYLCTLYLPSVVVPLPIHHVEFNAGTPSYPLNCYCVMAALMVVVGPW